MHRITRTCRYMLLLAPLAILPFPEPTNIDAQTRTAGASAQATAAARAIDPRVDEIPEPFRRNAIEEVVASKNYCEGNPVLAPLFDCACLSKMVLHYRIAHAKEYHLVDPHGQGNGGWEPFPQLLVHGKMFDCSECIDDARITKSTQEKARKNMMPSSSEADKKFMADCVSQKFLPAFRAQPYIGDEDGIYLQAVQGCLKQLRH